VAASRRLFSLAICASAFAQQTLKFEVASIREHEKGKPISMIGAIPSGSRLNVTTMSVADLVSWAYNVKPWQVDGGPAWAGAQGGSRVDRSTLGEAKRFNIAAKAEGDRQPKIEEFRLMVQSLLAERFHVEVHRETREAPVYALTADKNGPKFKESGPDANGVLMMKGRGKITGTGATMEQLIGWFSNANGVDRPVVDQTGLGGRYDFTLEWSIPRLNQPADDSGPSIFTAMREQLGLRLEPKKAPLEFVVIDRASMPDEN
jgi:uncharacterized protein (TIGR03435 family)